MDTMKSEDIVVKINLLRKNRENYHTNSNIIFSKFPEKEWEVLETEQSIVILLTEPDVTRIIFGTVDFNDLKQLVHSIGNNVIIEVVSKDKSYMKSEIEMLGLKKLVMQIRVSCRNVSEVFLHDSKMIKFFDSSVIDYASEADIDQINEMLWNTFDTRSSHLKTKIELSEQIKRGEFAIYKNVNNEIEMIIQHISSPKSFYFNQIINNGDRALFHALTLNLLKKYCDSGGKYAYAWVDEGNIASLKYFEKYKLLEDGVYNSIYYV